MKLLLAYRVMAYVTGVLLILLCFVSVPLEYIWDDHRLNFLGFAHGWLYMIYVLVALKLSLRERWSIKMTVLVALAGTIPFASFVAEHKVLAQIKAKAAAPEGATASASSV